MDCPVTIIFSELLPLFGLDATAICALACTCVAAATSVRGRTTGPGNISIPRYKITFFGACLGHNHAYGSGIFVIYRGLYSNIETRQAVDQLLHKLVLNRYKYTIFRVSDHWTTGDKTAMDILRNFGAKLATPKDWWAGNYLFVSDSTVYTIEVDPLAILPEILHDQIGIITIRR